MKQPICAPSNFEEVANVCHRALVFDRGQVVAELSGAELDDRETARRGIGERRPRVDRRGSLQCSRSSHERLSPRAWNSPRCRGRARCSALSGLWAAHIGAVPVHIFFPHPADHVSNPVQFSLAAERQGDRCGAGPGLDGADDGGTHRPDGRIRNACCGTFWLSVCKRSTACLGRSAFVLAGGLCVGLANGILVEVAQIDLFIATLGTGTVIYAIALWHTEGRQIIGALPENFLEINGLFLLGIPITTYYVARLRL